MGKEEKVERRERGREGGRKGEGGWEREKGNERRARGRKGGEERKEEGRGDMNK